MEAIKPVTCTCRKRFRDARAMSQHQRDSPRHALSSSSPVVGLGELVQRLSLRVHTVDSAFIPFDGDLLPLPLGVQPGSRISQNPVAFAEGGDSKSTDKKQVDDKAGKGKGKKKKRNQLGARTNMGSKDSSYSQQSYQMKFNPETGNMMDMSLDQDWALCDKDCGWCGHCAESYDY